MFYSSGNKTLNLNRSTLIGVRKRSIGENIEVLQPFILMTQLVPFNYCTELNRRRDVHLIEMGELPFP